jgi:hypothetical protein
MSHATDTTPKSLEVVVKVVTGGSTSVLVSLQPALWTGNPPFHGSVEFPVAGDHEVSFQLPWLSNQLITSKIRNCPTTTHENPSANGILSTSVSKRDQSCPSGTLDNKPTKGCTETQPGRITPCSTVVPQSSLTVPESPTKATVADSVVDSPSRKDVVTLAATPLLPTAADPIDSPSVSLPRSGQKRGRQVGDVDEDGRPPKKGRVLDSQDRASRV